MPKLNIAFLYNVRHVYPDPNDPRTQLEADFDDPKTIDAIISNLKQCGYHVLPIEANEKAYLALYESRKNIDLVFNYSEGIYGNDREAQIPAILEMLQLPYTGSAPLTQAIGLNKNKTKEILSFYGIPTPLFQIFRQGNEALHEKLKFPLIVKPNSQGSGAGITNKSVVHNEEDLRRQLALIINIFKQPALVEPFLDGREFSVAMLGNPPRILPVIEADHSLLPKEYLPLDSLEVKWLFEEQSEENHLICPARIEGTLKERIEKVCLDVWRALEVRDWCRLDIRCDKNGNPYVLEINSPPGIIPPEISKTSYFPLIARTAGISYQELLKSVIEVALARYKKE